MVVGALGRFYRVFGNGRLCNLCGGKFGGVSQFTLFGWLAVCRASKQLAYIDIHSRSSQSAVLWRSKRKSFGEELKS